MLQKTLKFVLFDIHNIRIFFNFLLSCVFIFAKISIALFNSTNFYVNMRIFVVLKN